MRRQGEAKQPTRYDWFDADGRVVERDLTWVESMFVLGGEDGMTGLTRKVSAWYMTTHGLSREDVDKTAVHHG